jgi:hypothetical protein
MHMLLFFILMTIAASLCSGMMELTPVSDTLLQSMQ